MNSSSQDISVESGYVVLERPDGYKIVIDEQVKLVSRLAEFCRQANCYKVLVRGSNIKVDLSPLEIYELGKVISKQGLQIAVVETHNASRDDVYFLETVTSNRGGPILFFDNEDAAKQWLDAL